MTAEAPVSLWDRTSVESEFTGDFPDGAGFDVVIVGGGYTGLSTALHCAEKGLSAHVIEAQQIGHGGSGRNVGLVNAAAWLPPAQVSDRLGQTYGPRFLERFGRGPLYVFSLIEKHQIRCEATRTGTIHAAHAPSGFRNLQERHAQWQKLGEPVDLLDRGEASSLIGSNAFFGGLVDHRAGTVNPMAYCRGLARAAIGAGATISTGVKATGLVRDGGKWRVVTNRGAVEARAVVLGTNAYTDDLWPGLSRSYTTIHYFQLSTTPLGERVARILPERQGLWDTGTIMFSLRRDMENRLIVGSMGRLLGDARSGLSRRWAAKTLARLFPALGEVSFEEAWDGRIAMTPEHLPRINRLAEGLYTPIGYNGRGIGTGTVFGQAMAELLSGSDPADLPLPVTQPKSVPFAPLISGFFQTTFAASQFIRSL